MVSVKFKRLKTYAQLPTKATAGSACYDAFLPTNYDALVPFETRIIPLGWAVAIPKGYEIQVRPRSGLASKGIFVSNSPGCIDSDYRGEVGVILTNFSNMIFPLNQGDRICQFKVSEALEMDIEIEDELDDTERGEGGWGSTGE